MKRHRGMTLTELLIALGIASIIGAGVVAMTEAVGRVLDDGRTERERTIAAAVAASRLSSVVAPSNCALALHPDIAVFWKADTRSDDRIQASEVNWVRFDEDPGELILEWVEFPESFSPNERNQSDRTCSSNEDFTLLRTEYQRLGYLSCRVLLDGIKHVEYAMLASDCTSPLTQRRISWRLVWMGASGIDATTVVTAGLHTHAAPEEDG